MGRGLSGGGPASRSGQGSTGNRGRRGCGPSSPKPRQAAAPGCAARTAAGPCGTPPRVPQAPTQPTPAGTPSRASAPASAPPGWVLDCPPSSPTTPSPPPPTNSQPHYSHCPHYGAPAWPPPPAAPNTPPPPPPQTCYQPQPYLCISTLSVTTTLGLVCSVMMAINWRYFSIGVGSRQKRIWCMIVRSANPRGLGRFGIGSSSCRKGWGQGTVRVLGVQLVGSRVVPPIVIVVRICCCGCLGVIVHCSLLLTFYKLNKPIITPWPPRMLPRRPKKSLSYEFELINGTALSTYKGHNKIYQLNLSKLLLKCPQSPFGRREQEGIKGVMVVNQCRDVRMGRSWARKEFMKDAEEKDKGKEKEKEKQSFKQENVTEAQSPVTLAPRRLINQVFVYSQQQQSCSHQLVLCTGETTSNPQQIASIKSTKYNQIPLQQPQINKSNSPRKQSSTQINNNSTNTEGVKSETAGNFGLMRTVPKTKNKKISMVYNYNNHYGKPKTMSNNILLLPDIKPKNSKQPHNITTKSNLHIQPPMTTTTTATISRPNVPLLSKSPEDLKTIKSQSYSLMQYPSTQLILSHRGSCTYEIASLTKIMTFYTVVNILSRYALRGEEQKVRIDDIAMEMSGTSAEIESGEVFTVEQLLYGLMLPSGNDAATALAEWGGRVLLGAEGEGQVERSYSQKQKIKAFLAQMNKNAKLLQLNSTYYANQHGLPNPESKSTSNDVARLVCQCLNNNFFRKVVSTQSYKCTVYNSQNPENKRQILWINTNKLLRRQGFIGVKTGITVTAGPCLASAYQFRDKIYICVVLRSNKVSRRFKQTRKILAWSLERLYKVNITQQESKLLTSLRRNKPEIDSDYSEDEQQFNYEENGKAQFKKRSNIINYQM